MKKIQTASTRAKKQKRNQTIVGVVLVLLMVGSAFGVMIDSFGNKNSDDRLVYEGVEFIRQNNFWFAEKKGFNLILKHVPSGSSQDTGLNLLTNYYSKPLYIYTEDKEAEAEIYRNLFYYNSVAQRVQSACPEDSLNISTTCEEEWPTKDCEENLIIIIEGEEFSISQNKNCVVIQGARENLTQITDEFLFGLF
jgi:hypothetical protein